MSPALPFVSVVIPMRNEEASIGACLDAVLAQNYPSDHLEVLVVDGDSDDGSAALIERYARETGRVRLLHNPRRIVPPALNTAIRAARGDVIVRVDGHTRIAADYVSVGVETLARSGAENVGGPMNAVGGGLVGDAVARATSSRFGVGSYFHFGTEEREVDTVYLGMWPRSVFRDVGLFDEELVRNQDDEFNYRLRKAGGRIVLTPRMRSWYQNRQSLRRLARQYFEYGQWKVRVLQKHPRQMSWRHFVPPLFVAGLALLCAAAPFLSAARWLAVALGGFYAACVLSLGFVLAGRDGARAALTTALTFAILHVCWGTGFLFGLLLYADRWRAGESAPPALDAGDGTASNLSHQP